MTIKEESTYKKLKMKKAILVFTVNLKMFVDDDYLKGFFKPQDFIKMMNKIAVYTKKGLIDFELQGLSEEVFKSTRELEQKYPDQKEVLKSIESDIAFIQMNCIMATTFPMTVMSFIERNGHCFQEHELQNMIIAVRDLLRLLPYNRSSQERIYLSQKYPNHLWYDAYCIENPNVPREEHTFLLEELLKTTLLTPIKAINNIEKSIQGHLKHETCELSSNAYRSLLHCRTSLKNQSTIVLFAIEQSGRKQPISAKEEIEEFFSAHDNQINTLENLINLFDILYYAYPIKSWLCYFCEQLIENIREDCIDYLHEYIKMTYPHTVSSYFEDEYLIKKEEKREIRSKLVFTLKKIAEKKDFQNKNDVLK